MKKTHSLALVLAMLLCLAPALTFADPEEQKCGDDLYWAYDAGTCTLTITGSGAMYDFGDYWNDDNSLPLREPALFTQ